MVSVSQEEEEEEMKIRKTERGFDFIEFKDSNQEECSLQKSSAASRDLIWFGINNANPKILASRTKEGGTGWVKYDVPSDVNLNTRMHLDRKQVFKLLPSLLKFVIIGRI